MFDRNSYSLNFITGSPKLPKGKLIHFFFLVTVLTTHSSVSRVRGSVQKDILVFLFCGWGFTSDYYLVIFFFSQSLFVHIIATTNEHNLSKMLPNLLKKFLIELIFLL